MTMSRFLGTLSISFAAVASVIVAATPPATGYEISIYQAYPAYLYFFMAAALVCGFSVLVYSASGKDRSNWWIAGLAGVLIINSLVLLLPVFRGYIFYGRTDPGQHFGFAKDIELIGHFGASGTRFENFYPASHIWVASFSKVTGLDLTAVAMATPWIFWLLYVFSILILSKLVAKNLGQQLIIISFALPLSFGFVQSSFFPTMLTFFLAPLTLFLLYRRDADDGKFSYTLLFILMVLLLPFMHAGDTVSFLILFICLAIAKRVYKWLKHKQGPPLALPDLGNAIAILSAAWLIWFSSFSMFGKAVKSVFDWLVYGAGISPAIRQLSILERAQATLPDILEVFLRTHGHNLLFFIIALAILLKWLSKRKQRPSNYLIFSVILVVFLILVPVFYATPGVGEYRRVLPYAILAATFVIGFGLGDWLWNYQHKVFAALPITAIVVMVTILGIFNVHYSPFIKSANQQISHYDVSGMDWFLQHQNGENLIDQQRVMQYTLSAIILGNEATPRRIRWGTSEEYQTPDHFGYDQHDMYGQSYQEDRYFLNDKFSRELLPAVFPKFEPYWRWNNSDWNRLERDPSVFKVYQNGEFEVFYVRANP
jgi:hypothetical protein